MLSLQSPAKINLFLKIIGKRPDGYHEIASLFQAIDLCDTMHFKLSEKDVFTCSDLSLPTDGKNLVIKARELFRRKTGIEDCISIQLQKNIPQQAGLGGGSSNAATTLWALNNLCGNPVSDMQLSEWGAEIGSDVSFFLSQGTAYCTGRGEVLRPLAPLSHPVWIVKPPIGLSTQKVYAELKLDGANLNEIKRDFDVESILESFKYLQNMNTNLITFNDLEEPAFKLKPELEALKNNLKACGFSTVLMSGSGSSFFCIGNGDLSTFSKNQIFRSQFINRKPNSWY